MASARTPPERWIDAGLRALALGGPAAVRVETLARDLGVTKGGFYWHFDDRDALFGEMLGAFERAAVDDVIELVQQVDGDARAQLRRLFSLAVQRAKKIHVELAIRDWGRRDSKVARHVRRIDNRRMDFMRSLFAEICSEEAEIEARSLLAFSLFIANDFIKAEHGSRSRGEVLELAEEWLLK